MGKYNLIKLILLLFSELFCFEITRINLFSYHNDAIYVTSINIVQIVYFLPVFLISLYFFISTKSNKSLLINSTIALILYAIFLHIFIVPITSFFTNTQGIINFTKYASKIYFICLPLVGVRIWGIKKEKNIKNCFWFVLTRIIFLLLITLVFKNLFELKGVLYACPLCEMIYTLIFIRKYKKTGI